LSTDILKSARRAQAGEERVDASPRSAVWIRTWSGAAGAKSSTPISAKRIVQFRKPAAQPHQPVPASFRLERSEVGEGVSVEHLGAPAAELGGAQPVERGCAPAFARSFRLPADAALSGVNFAIAGEPGRAGRLHE